MADSDLRDERDAECEELLQRLVDLERAWKQSQARVAALEIEIAQLKGG